jgi:hypothetical protein
VSDSAYYISGFCMIVSVNRDYRISLNSINHSIFVMVKCGLLFEVRIEFLNIVYTSFGFKWLKFLQYYTWWAVTFIIGPVVAVLK